MDRKYTKNNKALAFIKRNIYYIIMLLCLAAIATMVTITLINKSKTPGVDVIAPPVNEDDDVNNDDDDDDVNNNDDDDQNNNDDDDDDDVITPDPIVFASPVENINIIRDYTMDSVVWYPSLGVFKVSKGIVFGGEEGDDVFAAYGGEVEDVTSDQLYGNRVVIKHEEDLRTIYYSLGDVSVSKGQTVTKGQRIGTMGVTATRELSDGPHVHFSATLNDVIISPYDYLDAGDK